jgi:hypothetical protein
MTARPPFNRATSHRVPSTRRLFALAVALVSVSSVCVSGAAFAQEKSKGKTATEKRGGYSYSQAQSINTYGDSRGKSGAADSLRDPNFDRQTNSGPFDHGFFFDSGIGPGQHGGSAPFLH